MLFLLITGLIQVMETYYLIFNIKKRIPFGYPLFRAKVYELATTTVVLATAVTAVASCVGTAATAAAEEDEDKDDYPRAIITTKVTHLRKPPFLFSSHTMQRIRSVLLI